MRATLTPACPLFTRPAYSSIRFGLFPAAWTTVGPMIIRGIRRVYSQDRYRSRSVVRGPPSASCGLRATGCGTGNRWIRGNGFPYPGSGQSGFSSVRSLRHTGERLARHAREFVLIEEETHV